WSGGGQMPGTSDMASDSPGRIDLGTTRDEDSTERSAACRPFVFADSYPLGEATRPNQQINFFTVAIQSPGLLYGSRKAVHDWLEAKGNAKAKQQEDAAKARTAPKL